MSLKSLSDLVHLWNTAHCTTDKCGEIWRNKAKWLFSVDIMYVHLCIYLVLKSLVAGNWFSQFDRAELLLVPWILLRQALASSRCVSPIPEPAATELLGVCLRNYLSSHSWDQYRRHCRHLAVIENLERWPVSVTSLLIFTPLFMSLPDFSLKIITIYRLNWAVEIETMQRYLNKRKFIVFNCFEINWKMVNTGRLNARYNFHHNFYR